MDLPTGPGLTAGEVYEAGQKSEFFGHKLTGAVAMQDISTVCSADMMVTLGARV